MKIQLSVDFLEHSFFFGTDFNGEVVARLQAYLLHVRRLKFKFEMVPPEN